MWEKYFLTETIGCVRRAWLVLPVELLLWRTELWLKGTTFILLWTEQTHFTKHALFFHISASPLHSCPQRLHLRSFELAIGLDHVFLCCCKAPHVLSSLSSGLVGFLFGFFCFSGVWFPAVWCYNNLYKKVKDNFADCVDSVAPGITTVQNL